MKKLGESLNCPKCKKDIFRLILQKVDAQDEETGETEKITMWGLECMNCGYCNSYLDADAFASLEIEKVYIESELKKRGA